MREVIVYLMATMMAIVVICVLGAMLIIGSNFPQNVVVGIMVVLWLTVVPMANYIAYKLELEY